MRLMFLLPCFQWGILYRRKLEEKDRLPGIWYFGIHTFAVMMNHIMALMVFKTLFAAAAKYTHLFAGFINLHPGA